MLLIVTPIPQSKCLTFDKLQKQHSVVSCNVFHQQLKAHAESWNPMWSVGTILNGLLSFMYESNITTGSVSSSKADKKRLAAISLEQNLRSPMFRKLFPEWVEEHKKREERRQVPLVDTTLCIKTIQLLATKPAMQLLGPHVHAYMCYVRLTTMSVGFMQEQEAQQQAQPAQRQAPRAELRPKRTLGSTLIALGIVTVVIALLLIPLLSS